MKWLRKKIIDWLFGCDYISYKELFDTYQEVYKVYVKNYEAYENSIKHFNNMRGVANDLLIQNYRLLTVCDTLLKTLKENGIDIDKIDFNEKLL